MNPEERKCGNCWCWNATDTRPGISDLRFSVCRLRPDVGHATDDGLRSESWACAEHRTAAEQAARWEARAAGALAAVGRSTRELVPLEALEKGRVEERRATVAWLRDTVGCTDSATGHRHVLANCLEAGEHRKEKP